MPMDANIPKKDHLKNLSYIEINFLKFVKAIKDYGSLMEGLKC
jgi:hypothetical protein